MESKWKSKKDLASAMTPPWIDADQMMDDGSADDPAPPLTEAELQIHIAEI